MAVELLSFIAAVDFFISGLPMKYEEGQKKYNIESAGIIEIHASQQGNDLELNPEAEVEIAMASHEPGDDFNLYKMDAESKKWVRQSGEAPPAAEVKQDEAASFVQSFASQELTAKLEAAELDLKTSEAMVKRLEASKPFEPKEESKGYNRFSANVSNLNDFPELAIYRDVMFRAGEENKDFDNRAYSIDWDNAVLAKKGGSYVLTLHKDEMTSSFIVHPVFEGEGYNMAQKIYKQKTNEYQDALVEYKAKEGEKQQEVAALTEGLKQSHLAAASKTGETTASAIANPGNLTFRHFTIRSFGIWSLNKLTTVPQGGLVIPRFTDEQGNELQFAMHKIYMVEKGRNVLFTFSDKEAISYNPEKGNILWGVTDDNKIAVFTYEDFAALGKQSGAEYNFVMKVSESDLNDETQLEYFLNI